MTDYEYTPLYYGTPCQVKYCDSPDLTYAMGIAWKDMLITHDGEIKKIDDVIQQYSGMYHFDKVVIELSWVDLNNL